MANSMQDLLQIMAQGSVTQGWGAISVFGRAKLNRLLEQQYIESFKDHRFLPSFMGSLALDNSDDERAELEGIELGKPLLSFTTASLTNSRALLTMNIVAGHYNAVRRPQSAARTIATSFSIAEQHGFTLEIDIDLSFVVGEVDRQGRVTLKLSEGLNFRCNLAGEDDAANQRLAEYFKEAFASMPPSRSVFELGRLNLRGYSSLTPKSFRILTQAAPGAKVRGASNYGEGGVVVFIRLNGNGQSGQFPPSANFPYLIPDDKDDQGNDKFSASLILSSAMLPDLGSGDPDVLASLMFPGANAFVPAERHTPTDLAVFGNISPTLTSINIYPLFATIRAGQTQRFVLHDWQGREITAGSWQAFGLENHADPAQGSISEGLYRAANPSVLGRDTLRVVVKATAVIDAVTYTASALVLVVFDNMKVAPRIAVSATHAQTPPTRLAASVLGGTSVTWALTGPQYGSLQVENGQASFTPDARARRRALQAQRISAMASEAQSASVLLVNGQQMLRIEPPFQPHVRQSTTVQLKDDASLLPGLARRWKMLGGEGSVDASGLFSAPAQATTSDSVVACEIVNDGGVILSTGYSVIELSELQPEATWTNLNTFTIRVPGGSDQGRVGSLYGNGYQQLPVEIVIRPESVGGEHYRLSVTELASIRLVDDASLQQIDFVDAALEGIPEDDPQHWRTRTYRNRFQLAAPKGTHEHTPQQNEPSLVTYFVHTRANTGTVTFHATFQADNQLWWTSKSLDTVNKTIELTPLPIPPWSTADYTTFTWERVDGGSPNNPDPSDDDWFYLHLKTLDYWKLECRHQGVTTVPFETMDFVSVDGTGPVSTSTIRWESEQLDETLFSWTGYIFSSPEELPDAKVQFDKELEKVMDTKLLDVAIDEGNYTAGTLVLTLHRTEGVTYVRPDKQPRAQLSRDLAVVLLDVNGNPHKRRISFLPASLPGDRNKLQHAGFTPPPVPPA